MYVKTFFFIIFFFLKWKHCILSFLSVQVLFFAKLELFLRIKAKADTGEHGGLLQPCTVCSHHTPLAVRRLFFFLWSSATLLAGQHPLDRQPCSILQEERNLLGGLAPSSLGYDK